MRSRSKKNSVKKRSKRKVGSRSKLRRRMLQGGGFFDKSSDKIKRGQAQLKSLSRDVQDKLESMKATIKEKKYSYDKKSTAEKILRNIEKQEKAAHKVDMLCDSLFCDGDDEELCSQYKNMKSKGNKYETLNLCKNYSRVTAKKK